MLGVRSEMFISTDLIDEQSRGREVLFLFFFFLALEYGEVSGGFSTSLLLPLLVRECLRLKCPVSETFLEIDLDDILDVEFWRLARSCGVDFEIDVVMYYAR